MYPFDTGDRANGIQYSRFEKRRSEPSQKDNVDAMSGLRAMGGYDDAGWRWRSRD
jgi:hypothetical protein